MSYFVNSSFGIRHSAFIICDFGLSTLDVGHSFSWLSPWSSWFFFLAPFAFFARASFPFARPLTPDSELCTPNSELCTPDSELLPFVNRQSFNPLI